MFTLSFPTNWKQPDMWRTLNSDNVGIKLITNFRGFVFTDFANFGWKIVQNLRIYFYTCDTTGRMSKNKFLSKIVDKTPLFLSVWKIFFFLHREYLHGITRENLSLIFHVYTFRRGKIYIMLNAKCMRRMSRLQHTKKLCCGSHWKDISDGSKNDLFELKNSLLHR